MIVVAGVGNVFFGDDGFGPAVIAALLREPPPEDVRVVDAGVRTMHLAYDLADGVDLFIAVDAYDSGETPGTLTVLELDLADDLTNRPDGHGMLLGQLLALTRQLGAGPRRTLLVGCQPATLADGVGLSPTVASAVEPAATLVRCQIEQASRGDLASTEVGDRGARGVGDRDLHRRCGPLASDARHVEP